MELRPENQEKIVQLMEKGVALPNPLTIDIGDDVDVGRISGDGVTIYPGCRIHGHETVISRGAQIGREGPVTIEDCQIGPEVALKGGYFNRAVFLKRAGAGSGAHVREGCILEEAANCAHCVGLKQTILFPFVTLGSLINFCDCLMAGGTSRRDHSEVGSSYIHFNFSAEGDKATASLFGDVPEGVMLNQPPIFLGGQGGAVGPLRVGYGNVISAGTILRKDVLQRDHLIVGKPYRGGVFPFVRDVYAGVSRIAESNIRYLSHLAALKEWYIHVRKETFREDALGEWMYAGAVDKLMLAKKERVRRLRAVSEKMPRSAERHAGEKAKAVRLELHEKIDSVCALFDSDTAATAGVEFRDRFLKGLHDRMTDLGTDHVRLIQGLPASVSTEGTHWLNAIVHELCRQAADLLPSLRIFRKQVQSLTKDI